MAAAAGAVGFGLMWFKNKKNGNAFLGFKPQQLLYIALACAAVGAADFYMFSKKQGQYGPPPGISNILPGPL
jgi:uncharacterized OsmC-like protein